MEFLIPLKDIVIGPGKRFDPSTGSEEEVIALIKKTYGFLAENMDVSIQEGMVRIRFRDATPEKVNEALAKMEKAVNEAQQRRFLKALKLFHEVLAVIPEHVDARRNLAKTYLELGNMGEAKKHLTECLQIDPKDSWSYIMLGNIYARNERNLDAAEFYYKKCVEVNPNDGMVLNNYAGLMMEKGNFTKAEELFKKALKLNPGYPHTYFGLALLYKVAGHPEESLTVLEKLLFLMPKTQGIESSQIYKEAENLYREIRKEIGPKGMVH
jgi:tetratricopeptide (TPR) repeat protein